MILLLLQVYIKRYFTQYTNNNDISIDSCIGGKTGINYKNIINSLGNYYQPHSVFIYNDIIKYIPREFIAGIPEIIKCGLIKKNSIKILKDREK